MPHVFRGLHPILPAVELLESVVVIAQSSLSGLELLNV